jgi:1-acyl-sn-glycerol-3-phosphate acyltransferase
MNISLTERLINSIIRGIVRLVCVVDYHELDRIPREGPVLLASNHTTNFEAPIYYVLMKNRLKKTALGKKELWSNPFTRFLMQIWGIIPVNRGAPDRRALKRSLESLDAGALLGIAPEGTRSVTGQLRQGLPGAAMLAVQRSVPVYPLVQWGLQDLPRNIRRLRRTRMNLVVGEPFYVEIPGGVRPTARQLRRIADEIMYQLAILLPPEYRGYYSDLSQMTTEFIIRR